MKSFNGSCWLVGSLIFGVAAIGEAQTVTLNYALTVQPIVLLTAGQTAPTNTSVAANPQYELDQAATQQVWAQAGIEINFASNIIFEHDPTDSNSLNSVLVPTGLSNANATSIFSGNAWSNANGAYPAFISTTPLTLHPVAPQINLFLVQSINGSVGTEGFSNQGTVSVGTGLGGVSSGVSISMSSQAAFPNVQLIAHEIGHQLGLYHPSDYLTGGSAPVGSSNYVNLAGATLSLDLMEPPIDGGLYAGSSSQLYSPNANPTGDGKLTAAQIAQVQKFVYNSSTNPSGLLTTISPFSYTYPTAIPEPSSSALVAGLAVLLPAWLGFRRRQKVAASHARERCNGLE